MWGVTNNNGPFYRFSCTKENRDFSKQSPLAQRRGVETRSKSSNLNATKKKHRCKMTPNSSVFGHCVNFGLIRLNAFRLGCHSSIRRGPRTEHVRGLLQRRSIPDSLCWRVLHCVSNQPVHIWLPRSVARKNNHGLTRNPREPSDWQAVGGKKP